MRRMPLVISTVVAAFLLGACSTCFVDVVPTVRPLGSTQPFELQDTQLDVTRIVLPGELDVRLGQCQPLTESYICVFLRVFPGSHASFVSKDFTLERPGGPSETIAFPTQQYQILCETRTPGPIVCPEPPSFPGKEIGARVLVYANGYKEWRFERWAVTVLPTLDFQGRDGQPDPPAWKYISQYSRWQEYRLQLLPVSRVDATDAILKLPSLQLDGREVILPAMRLKEAPTKICPAYV